VIYGGAIVSGFKDLGHNVVHFSWSPFLSEPGLLIKRNLISEFHLRLENKFLCGYMLKKINFRLLEEVAHFKPHMVFIYRGAQITSETISTIRDKYKAVVFGYNNDDPFSDQYPWFYWRHFKRAAPKYSHVFSYRFKNIYDFQSLDLDSSLLRSYYRSENNFPTDVLQSRFECDVIFVGHFENDGRDKALLDLLNDGINLKIFGPEWRRSGLYGELRESLGYEIEALDMKDYNIAINSSKIAIVFLSKLNNDTYTRRCFEIPATKTLMLAEYTDDLASMFDEDTEAVFFRSICELRVKIKKLLQNEALIEKIASRGHARLLRDGHEVTDRCKQIISVFRQLNGNVSE